MRSTSDDAPADAETAVASDLSPLETEVIDLFVHLARLLGQPKSVAEIYGLLFISPQPLAMDTLIERLRLSKGSASQGLKVLRSLGAVKPVYVPGDRKDFYEAELELRKVLTGFLKEQVEPRLGSGLDRVERIEHIVDRMPAAERSRIDGRLQKLRIWQKTARKLVPLIRKFLGA